MRIFQFPQIFQVRAAPRQRAHLHPALLRKRESASSAKSTADGEVFDDTTVTVFAAKSLNSVMETLISEYNKTQPNVKLVGSYDSSGTLMIQIEEGASCDVFFLPQQQNRWISLRLTDW